MDPLLEQFLIESRDFLQDIADNLIELEENPEDQAIVNELFRLVHTLKGNSGLFDFPEMTRVLHASEDLLDGVRAGKIEYTQEVADLLLDAMDFVSMLCDEIEAERTTGGQHAEKAAELTKKIRAHLKEEENTTDPAEPDDGAEKKDSIPLKELSGLDERGRSTIEEVIKEKGSLHCVVYEPAEECFYQGDDPLYLARQTPELCYAVLKPREEWGRLEELDAYRCNLTFLIFSTAGREELLEHFRYVMDQVRILTVEEKNPQKEPTEEAGSTAKEKTQQDTTLKDIKEELLSTQLEILTLPDDVDWIGGRIRAAASVLEKVIDRDDIEGLKEATERAVEGATAAPLLEWLNGRLSNREDSPQPIKDKEKAEEKSEPMERAKPQDRAQPDNRGQKKTEESLSSRILKVDQAKIDRLMNLIGEMVVTKNALPYLANRAESVYGVRNLGREIKSHYSIINRIVEEMQDAIMQARMVPVGTMFKKFPRLVRDIAKRLGKEVELVITGEDTEVDKNIIESLADPLVHIIRNSLDHGIETPEERKKAGKPPKGRLCVRATQESDRVVIEISDDGRGIDPEKIKMKAYQKGIIDESMVERITDREAINLIMAPGFSTAEKVSDLSGRGVGMDVVKNAVEKVKGELTISSSPQKGTTITLMLPLSIAVTNVMIVESDGRKFGVPVDAVIETVRIKEEQIHYVKDKKVVLLRNNVVPLFNLNDLLGINKPQELNEEGEAALLVLKTPSGNVGVVVDQFYETTDIILKPLEGVLAGIKTYAGTALLGDGSVLIILNPKELV